MTRPGPFRIHHVCLLYLLFATCFASLNLEDDEFTFFKEPYEMLGGDYTLRYARAGEYGKAAATAARAYFFFWNYRPLNAPVISEEHRRLFRAEEERFGYAPPEKLGGPTDKSEEVYARRLIVPEPERFHAHGAGKPLLSAVLNVPVLALVKLIVSDPRQLLHYQFHRNYHAIFIVTRLVPLLCGLASILILYVICRRETDEEHALWGTALFALFPICIVSFPNLHHDAVMVPFLLGAAFLYVRGRYVAGGALFGLALAAKNSAVFLLAPVGITLWMDGIRWIRTTSSPEAGSMLASRLKGTLLFGLMSLVLLTPFANPKSYAEEVLSPLFPREVYYEGKRAEATFTPLTASEFKKHEREQSERFSKERTSITYLQRMVPFQLILLLLIPSFPLLLGKVHSPFGRFSLLFLLALFPFAVVFGSGLGYRSLPFVPFMGFLCAEVLSTRQMKGILLLFLCIDLLFCLDPISVGFPRLLGNQDTLPQALLRAFGG